MQTAELRFSVLGPVRAWLADTELDLGSPQQRAVLMVLLLAEGRQIGLSALIDMLWDDPPRTSAGTVRTYVSRLRKEFRKHCVDVIKSVGDGYAVPQRSASLDLTTFRQLVADARAARDGADVPGAAAILRDALALWQGPPLAGIPGGYAETQRVWLSELQFAALEERLELDLELGRHASVVGELRKLAARYPLRERLSELLMLALYRSGRQAEALAVFDTSRGELRELGIDPGPGLCEMHARILRVDPGLMPPGPAQPAAASG